MADETVKRVGGIEVRLVRIPGGFDAFVSERRIGCVLKVERLGEPMWQAEGSKRYRTIMTQAVEELLIREDLIDGIGW